MSLRTVSFSMTADEYALFAAEARCKGQTISGYCKTAAFSHLHKYGYKVPEEEKKKKEPEEDNLFCEAEVDSLKRLQRRKGYVYLLKAGDYYKIGVTRNNPHKRVAGMMKLPADVSVVNHIYVDWPYRVEAGLHRKYAEDCLNGEWFAFDAIPEEFR